MKEEDLELNTLHLSLSIASDGTLGVWAGQNVDPNTLDPGTGQYFIDVLNGLRCQIDTNLDHLAHIGAMMRFVQEKVEEERFEEEEEEFVFEPDPELLKKIEEAKVKEANGKVVKLHKKLH